MMKYFHGNRKRKSYFEGWFFKHQGAEQTIAFIPGLHCDPQGNVGAFIQVNTENESHYFRYPIEAFQADQKKLDIRIGANTFSEYGVSIDIDFPHGRLKGEFNYGSFTPIPGDIMGPYARLPMKSKHGIISMCHKVDGSVRIGSETIKIANGIGYIETDWGSSFPDRYLWTQGNNFTDGGCTSIFASVATVPFILGGFTGCICAIYDNGHHYRLSTYDGAVIEHWDEDGMILIQNEFKLVITAELRNAQNLFAPVDGNMERIVRENVSTHVHYMLYRNDEVIIDLNSQRASYEYAK